MVNLHSYHAEIDDEEIHAWIENTLDDHIIDENKFKTISEISSKVTELRLEYKFLDANNEIENFLHGRDLI